MKSGWLRGSLSKYPNQLESDGKRKHFSRIEDRLRHRKQQFHRRVNVSKGETLTDLKSHRHDFPNSSTLEEKSCNEFCLEQLDTSRSDKKLQKNEKMKRKTISECKTRNRSSHFPVVRPQSAPCNFLFRIKCAKQVKSVRILAEGRNYCEEKFETRSTRSACSTSRNQDEQFTVPHWPKGIGESLLQNKTLESEKSTEDIKVTKNNEFNRSESKSHTELTIRIIDQDCKNGKNYEEMFRNIPQECPNIHRNSDEPLESPQTDTLNYSNYPQDLINRHLILKGCEDDFSDGPLSSPERTITHQTPFKWDTNLSTVLAKSPKGGSCHQSCFSNEVSPPFAMTRPRSEHLGLKCCGYAKYLHCSHQSRYCDSCHCNCPKERTDWKPFELSLKKKENEEKEENKEIEVNEENEKHNENSERVYSEKIDANETIIASMDAACSPRKPSCCDLDIQVSENDNSYDLEDEISKTTRSVSTQVEDDLILSARDVCKIEQNNPCQDFCRPSDDHCVIEEVSHSLRCSKCNKIFENNHQDCQRCLATNNRRCQLDCNRNSNISHININCNCQSEKSNDDNIFRNDRRIPYHCLKNTIKSHGLTLLRNSNASPGCSKDNHCCCLNAENNFEMRNPAIPYSKLSFSKNDQQEGSHFYCERTNEMRFCTPKVSPNSRKPVLCSPGNVSHKTATEISSQTMFRQCLQSRKNHLDDGTEKKSFTRRDTIERRLYGDKLHSKGESLSPPRTGRSMPNKLFPHKTGDDHRHFFCNEIVNKHQNIFKTCTRNQHLENKTRPSAFRNSEYSNSDNEWSASPEEDISGHEVTFPKETRCAMNYLRQGKEILPKKRHLKRALPVRGQILKEENDETDNAIIEENEMYTSAYAKALAVFQKGCVPPVQTDLKKNRNSNYLQQKGTGCK